MMTIKVEEVNKKERCCSDCKTTKTPMWRGGPAGPKSLCNACGIRYRKQMRSQMMGMSNSMISNARAKKMKPSSSPSQASEEPSSSPSQASQEPSSSSPSEEPSSSSSPSQTPSSSDGVMVKKQRRLREEEQAAFCLLALSCDSVFA